jgi:hypothetical protein
VKKRLSQWREKMYKGLDEDHELRARRLFAHWAKRLAGHFPQQWIDRHAFIASAPASSWKKGQTSGRGLLTM